MSMRSSRKRTPTEKGRAYQLQLLYKEKDKAEARIRGAMADIEAILNSACSREALRQRQTELDHNFRGFMDVHAKCRTLNDDDDEKQNDERVVDLLDKEIFEMKGKIIRAMSETKDYDPELNRSRKTSKASSKASSRASSKLQAKLIEEETKMKELKIESDFLQKQHEAELAAKQALINLEIEKSEAKMKIFRQFDEEQEDVDLPKSTVGEEYVREYVEKHRELVVKQDEPQTLKTKQNSEVRERQPEKEESSVDKIASMIQYLQAPNVEIDNFSGDPLTFAYFLATFEEVVESKITDQKGRLTRLLKYLRGEPKDLVTSCMYLPAEECYQEAKNILVDRYGDPNRVLGEYRKKLRAWPKVKPYDTASLRKFQTYAVKFKSAARHDVGSFNSPETVQLLHSKLPSYLQNSWSRTAMKSRKRKGAEPGIEEFLKWLSEEVDIATDPLYSRDAMTETPKSKSSSTTVYATVPATIQCPLCNENHDLDDCVRFLRKTLEERRDFLFKSRLCFSCYQPSSKEHSARNCTQRRTCTECGKQHATGLHGYIRPAPQKRSKKPYEEAPKIQNVTSNSAQLSNPVISLCIVPVRIYGSNKTFVETNALLDTGSQGTFIKEELLDQLEQKKTSTTIRLKTLHGESVENCSMVSGLSVSNIADNVPVVKLPTTFSRKDLPVDQDEVPTQHKIGRFKYLQAIQHLLPKDDKRVSLGILIGSNCPSALEPLRIIPSENGGPYALKTALGWCVSGPISSSSSNVQHCNRIVVKDISTGKVSNHHFRIHEELKESSIATMLMNMYNSDFSEAPTCDSEECTVSQEDLKFLKMMEDGAETVDGHYQLPLPLRDKSSIFPNNRAQAQQRCHWLRKKLQSNTKMHQDYCKFMSNLFEKGYAAPASPESTKDQTWYLPHFGVYHPQKPDKIRVVLDCSASHQGTSLNKQLLQGPDLTNHLIGVLSRFRMEQVAIIADIEAMFYQVKVPASQYDLLRFLWWPNGDLQQPLKEYVMKVHIFGAVSSPSCANFAVKKTATDFESTYGEDTANTLRRNLYVDDLLKAYSSDQEAITSFPKVTKMCAAGGFHLTKVVSNSREVLKTINKDEVGKGFKELDLSKDLLPVERALGVHWSIENDCFGFRITLKDKPSTRRGMLSTISSIYDPLGFAGPFLLKGKLILQQLCAEQRGWDDILPNEHRMAWEKWRRSLVNLQKIKVRRCIKPVGFGPVEKASLHHFSDASEIAYGQVSYIRVENKGGEVSTSILMGKSRVAPLKQTTVPRLELTAALVSSRVGSQLKREISLNDIEEHYWTDSEVVLGYLQNERKRFHTFVANRVSKITKAASKEKWHYVKSKENPGDDATRGLEIESYNPNHRWFVGPTFLREPIEDILKPSKAFQVADDDKEVKVKVSVRQVTAREDFASQLPKTSSWFKMKRIVARIIRWYTKFPLNIESLKDAEVRIIKLVQMSHFKTELKLLEDSEHPQLPKGSPLQKLHPFIHEGIIRVGGRLQNSTLDFELKHPIVLPKSSSITTLIIRWCHNQCQHGGRGMTLYTLRQNGYWVISANSIVRSVISKCVTCRKLRGRTNEQVMANLPTDRVNDTPIFSNCGVDMFGPFYVKEGRKQLKRYGVMFTCLCSRAVHIETTTSLETDTFIQALRRFIARRGNVRQIRCDNGTNFVGTSNELQAALEEMDQQRISEYLQLVGADWIDWKRNPPLSSHHGGVWERQIRTARSILASLLETHSTSLTDEGLRTLLVEVEGIINSRPLTVESLSDVNSLIPLAPVNLLTKKSKVVLPPPGDFQHADLFCRRRWRRIQHLTNEFWVRWRKEYLNSLQQRSKWQLKQRNLQPGDVVLLRETSQRNDWKMARVTKCNVGQDGNVRSVLLRTSSGQDMERPITKLVLLVEGTECDSPPRD